MLQEERLALLVWVALWWRYPRGMQRVIQVSLTDWQPST
jgi:hypothetical protein